MMTRRDTPWFRTLLAALAITASLSSGAYRTAPELWLERQTDGSLSGGFGYSFIIGTYYEWNTDPTAIPGLFDEYSRRTGVQAEIEFVPVNLADPELQRNPLVIMTGNRHFVLTDEEIDNLRSYLLKGGFLYADDCGGADQSFRRLLNRILGEISLQELPIEHPLFSAHYAIERMPKIVDLYQGPPKAYGGYIDGRLAIVYTYDTDIPCGWEKNPDGSFVHVLAPGKHEAAIRFGVNVLAFALQQRLDHPVTEATE